MRLYIIVFQRDSIKAPAVSGLISHKRLLIEYKRSLILCASLTMQIQANSEPRPLCLISCQLLWKSHACY